MGLNLANRAFAFAATADLKPNESLLLVYMSLRARDTDPEPTFWGSKEEAAVALGRSAQDISANPTAAYDRVRVTLRGLKSKHAIELVETGRRGRQSSYLLTYGGRKPTP